VQQETGSAGARGSYKKAPCSSSRLHRRASAIQTAASRKAAAHVRGADASGLRGGRRRGHRRSRKLVFQVRLHASVLQEECHYDSTSTLRLHDADASTGRCTNYSLHASVIRKWLQCRMQQGESQK